MSSTAEIILFASCYTIIIPLGLVICIKLYYNLKNEEHTEKGKIIQRILKTYCLVQCVAWPLISLVFGIVLFTKRSIFASNNSILMLTIVSILRFAVRLNLLYVGFNSWIFAICRYVFTMRVTHDEPSCIKELRRLFIVTSILAPVLFGILDEAFIAYPRITPITAASDVMIRPNQTNVESTFYDTDHTLQNHTYIVYLIPQSPLFLFVEKHVSSSIKYAVKLGLVIAHSVFYSNIPEGILYTHIFIVNKRLYAIPLFIFNFNVFGFELQCIIKL